MAVWQFIAYSGFLVCILLTINPFSVRFTNILSNPFKRFEDMNMMRHTKTLGIVEVDSTVWKKLSDDEKAHILSICDKKLDEYYARIK